METESLKLWENRSLVHAVSVFLILIISGCSIKSNASQDGARTPLPEETNQLTEKATQTQVELPSSFTPAVDEAANLQLTFVSDRHEGYWGVYGIDMACPDEIDPCLGEPSLLFEVPFRIRSLDWSPNGQYLVFEGAGVDNKMDIYISSWDGSEMKNITSSSEFENTPSWLPSGERILYIVGRLTASGAIPEIVENTVDGSNTSVLSTPQYLFNILSPRISPDGKLLIYSAHVADSSEYQIYLTNMGTMETIKVTNDDYNNTAPVFSSDGASIVFERTKGNNPKASLILLELDSRSEVMLVTESQHGVSPAWFPSDNWIAFVSEGNNSADIYLINPYTRDQIHAVVSSFDDGYPAWRSHQ